MDIDASKVKVAYLKKHQGHINTTTMYLKRKK